jgi:hypothetical protein
VNEHADIRAEMLSGLEQAANGAFKPWFYRVRVSPRRWKRHRMPGMASRVSPAEARAIQAFQAFAPGRVRVSDLARQFHRTRGTIRAVLRDQSYQEYLRLPRADAAD